jgi:hypothetical protein
MPLRAIISAVLALMLTLAAAVAQAADAKAPAAKKPAAKAPAKSSKGKSTKAKAAPKETAPEKPIWTYRSRYEFHGKTVSIEIAQDNGEMRIYQGTSDIIADPMGFEVVFADGTKLGSAQMLPASAGREKGEDPKIGPGIIYLTEFKPVNGVKITQRIMKYNERPFLTIRIIVENLGTQPLQIARIAPISVAPGGMTGFKADVDVHTHVLSARGGFPVPEQKHPPIMTRFFDRGRNVMFLMGMLPLGHGDAYCEFKHDGAGWVGAAANDFSPVLTVAPGAKAESDSVCIGFLTEDSAAAETFYSWALGTGMHKATVVDGPKAWSTTEPGASFDELKEVASAWSKRGVRYALLQAGTKGNFAQLAKDMKKSGATLGAEIDPLQADDEDGAWVVEASDGRKWLNPAAPEAQEYLKKKVTALNKADAAFIVVGETAAPDDVFVKWGLTRSQAMKLGADAIVAGAVKTYMYGPSGSAMPAEPEALKKAAQSFKEIVLFGSCPPVVQVTVAGDAKNAIKAAQAEWPGVLEVVGKPAN